MSARDRYARVLRAPHVKPLLAASFLGRLPIGMHAVALVLFLREHTGSYGVAGAVTAMFALGAALGAPVIGRLIDRLGQRAVLVPAAFAHAALLAVLVVLGLADAPAVALGAVALLTGACIPPMSSVMRTLWPKLVGEDPQLVKSAFALESVMVELVFTVGPLLVAVLVTLAGGEVALLLAAALTVVGTLAFVVQPPSRAAGPVEATGPSHLLGALRSRPLRILLVTVIPVGFCLGAAEVAVPAFADVQGDRAMAGVLIAVWSLASGAAGLWYGGRDHHGDLAFHYARIAMLLPLGYLPLALAPSVPVMLLLLIPAGACIAPLLTASNQLVGRLALPGTETEAYTWGITALVVGVAVGNGVSGALVEGPGWETAFLVATGGGVLGAILAITRRHALAARPTAAA